jgi:hypothetical protein
MELSEIVNLVSEEYAEIKSVNISIDDEDYNEYYTTAYFWLKDRIDPFKYEIGKFSNWDKANNAAEKARDHFIDEFGVRVTVGGLD